MNYIVYEVKNKVNGKTYIGKHQTDNIYDDYLGSGKYLKRAINKYGKDCFEKIILYVFDNKKEMDDKEEELANDEYVKNKNTYNLKKGGQGGFDHLNDRSEKHIDRCKKGQKTTDKILKEKYGENYRSIIGKKGYLKYLKDYMKSDDPEIKKKRKESSPRFSGMSHTKEAKEKIGKMNSIHQQGNKNSQYGKCWIYNNEKSITIKKEELSVYLNNGWIKGRKMNF